LTTGRENLELEVGCGVKLSRSSVERVCSSLRPSRAAWTVLLGLFLSFVVVSLFVEIRVVEDVTPDNLREDVTPEHLVKQIPKSGYCSQGTIVSIKGIIVSSLISST
jgi:hypothetical protein